MGDLSEHFNRADFACHDGCGFDTVDIHLVDMLEAARAHFGEAVILDDGCRCPKHNTAVGGEPDSQHMLGKAADIKVNGFIPNDVADWFGQTYPDSHGVGRYNTFTHVDCRATKARWDLRK